MRYADFEKKETARALSHGTGGLFAKVIDYLGLPIEVIFYRDFGMFQ